MSQVVDVLSLTHAGGCCLVLSLWLLLWFFLVCGNRRCLVHNTRHNNNGTRIDYGSASLWKYSFICIAGTNLKHASQRVCESGCLMVCSYHLYKTIYIYGKIYLHIHPMFQHFTNLSYLFDVAFWCLFTFNFFSYYIYTLCPFGSYLLWCFILLQDSEMLPQQFILMINESEFLLRLLLNAMRKRRQKIVQWRYRVCEWSLILYLRV